LTAGLRALADLLVKPSADPPPVAEQKALQRWTEQWWTEQWKDQKRTPLQLKVREPTLRRRSGAQSIR
jgi:hypothetical protein